MVNTMLALVPVLVFLGPLKIVIRLIAAGAVTAFAGALLHGWLLDTGRISQTALSHWVAPITEEMLKALPVIWLVLRKRVGFLVDAAILGFAVGAGFALVENVEYLRALGESSVFLWIVRGFGTAVLHGGTTSILAVLGKGLEERRPGAGLAAFLPGLAAAIAIHSLYNQFLLPPMVATLVLFVTLPALLVTVFALSERSTRAWLGAGFDSDIDMLQSILSEDVEQTRIGQYLLALQSRFDGSVVADMLCLVRVRVELSIRAKGVLMAREAGVPMPVGEDLRANLNELRYLESSIGRTVPSSGRDLWQIHMLEAEGASGPRRVPIA